ncbi:hypothetical protein CHCC20333_1362 [Bacillus paralicheniformis]|nr:hypothetical protein CHCC20333_1362 [Bacillus paralicheniformis]
MDLRSVISAEEKAWDVFILKIEHQIMRHSSITRFIKIVLPDMTGSTFLAGLIV